MSPIINHSFIRLLAIGVMGLFILNSLDLIFNYPYFGITRFIHLDSDQNFSAWYSSMLLFVAGLISLECSQTQPNQKSADKITLLLFSALLFTLSADEISQFHEILGGYAAKYAGIAGKDFAHRSAWVWIGGPLIASVFGFFGWRMTALLRQTPKALIFLMIGFACILLGGVVLESTINFMNHDNLKTLWRIEIIAEEILEMIGSIMIATAMMKLRDFQLAKLAPKA